ncbi:MAG: hypothetical protein R8P61_32805 [Bacteroidia bacterium]|nr:hypothetical protein [Bacteroidia bacterium]
MGNFLLWKALTFAHKKSYTKKLFCANLRSFKVHKVHFVNLFLARNNLFLWLNQKGSITYTKVSKTSSTLAKTQKSGTGKEVAKKLPWDVANHLAEKLYHHGKFKYAAYVKGALLQIPRLIKGLLSRGHFLEVIELPVD